MTILQYIQCISNRDTSLPPSHRNLICQISGNLYMKPAWWYYPSCCFHKNSYDRIVWVLVCQMEWPNELCSLTSQQILCEIIFYLMFATYALATYGGQVLIWYLPYVIFMPMCFILTTPVSSKSTWFAALNSLSSVVQIHCLQTIVRSIIKIVNYCMACWYFFKILTQWQVGPWIYLVNWGSVRFT